MRRAPQKTMVKNTMELQYLMRVKSFQEHVQSEDFIPPIPDMVTLVTDSNNEESVIDKHTFQVGDDIYEKDLTLIPKPHIQYTPNKIKGALDERPFIINNNKQITKRYPS